MIPVPTFLEQGQIHVGDKALLDHLDAYSAPRLVEYFDPDPCLERRYDALTSAAAPMAAGGRATIADRRDRRARRARSRRTTRVGEYDIVILSAKESDGLETWLTAERLPHSRRRVARVLGSYIKQNMHFFVAKVNLERAGRSSASRTCARSRSPTSRRSSCCRSASAW